MCNNHYFESSDKSPCYILSYSDSTQTDKPFGGIPILLGGDCRQILLVIPRETKEQIIKVSLNSSYLWSSFKVFNLKENMRLSKNGLMDDKKIYIFQIS